MCRAANGTLIEPGLHYQTDLSAGGSEPDPDDVANAIWGHVGINFQQAMPASVTIDELVVVEQVLKPAIGVAGAHAVAAPGLLPTGDNSVPIEEVPLIAWHTGTRSRSARGHTFMASPLNGGDKVPGGNWGTTFLAQLQAFANACITIFAVGTPPFETTIRPVVYSRTRHERGQTPFTFNLTGTTVRPHPTWLRSRGNIP